MDCSMPKSRNYDQILKKLRFCYPGLPDIPRAPDISRNRNQVDIRMARKRLQLVNMLPKIDFEQMRSNHRNNDMDRTFAQCGSIDKKVITNLLAAGYSSVVDELAVLVKQEGILIKACRESGRGKTFTEDRDLVYVLALGLMDCKDAEDTEKIPEMVSCRISLADQLFRLEDTWLAKKMLYKAFDYLKYYDDEALDKMRAELWCLLCYLCIYYDTSLEFGFDVPAKGLTVIQNLAEGKEWIMRKTFITIQIAEPLNVYGLKNMWKQVDTTWMDIYKLSVLMMHVLCVKKAQYWQQEMNNLDAAAKEIRALGDVPFEETLIRENEKKRDFFKAHVLNELTSAIEYAEKVRSETAFMATTLRRGLFYQRNAEYDKALEDFNAMYRLAKAFDDRVAIPIALHRLGHSYKMIGDPRSALENFVTVWEKSIRSPLPELRANTLLDAGMTLLEEGHTWEANECVQHSHVLFRNNKLEDTPNDYDDVTWAMLGVTGGQHLWGRFSTLIKSQEKSRIDSIYNWKASRREFPVASMPNKWYEVEKCASYEGKYGFHIKVSHGGRQTMHVEYVPSHKKRLFQSTFPSQSSLQYSRTNSETSTSSGLKRLERRLTFADQADGYDPDDYDPEKDQFTKQRASMYEHQSQLIQHLSEQAQKNVRKESTFVKADEWLRHDFGRSVHLQPLPEAYTKNNQTFGFLEKKPRQSVWQKMAKPGNSLADKMKILLQDLDTIAGYEHDPSDPSANYWMEDTGNILGSSLDEPSTTTVTKTIGPKTEVAESTNSL